jgi:hypothetical protein
MRGVTHAALGAAAALPVAAVAQHFLPVLGAPVIAAGALGGLLTDVDHPHSLAGRLVPLRFLAVRQPVSPTFALCGWRTPFGVLWHRGPVHSRLVGLVASILVGLGVAWAVNPLLDATIHFLARGAGSLGWGAGAGALLYLGWRRHRPQARRLVELAAAAGIGAALNWALGAELAVNVLDAHPALQSSGTWGIVLGAALLAGWLVHLEADRLSPSPMPLWWPLSAHRIGPHRLPAVLGRVRHRLVLRGTWLEAGVQVACVLAVLRSAL